MVNVHLEKSILDFVLLFETHTSYLTILVYVLHNFAVDQANQSPYMQKWLLTETVNSSYHLCQQPLPIVSFTFIGAGPRSAFSSAPD